MHLKHPLDGDQQILPPFSRKEQEPRERLSLRLSLLVIVALSVAAWAGVVALIRLVL